jgi:hypothetical protein
MKIRILLLACLISTTLFAEQLPMGSWRTHLAYNNTEVITQTKDKIYAVSEGALFSVGKQDDGVEILSKISGLNDNNILRIGYSKENDILLIAYANSNIDLLTEDGIFNISDIYRKNMSGSKTINDIYFKGEYAYLSCDFGIVVLNLKKQEITDTYIIGTTGETTPVLSLAELNGKFYATTETAILTANTTGVNLANFENWKPLAATPTSGNNVRAVAYNNTLLLLQADGDVHAYSSEAWVGGKTFSGIVNINSNDGYLFVINKQQINYYRNGDLTTPTTISRVDTKMALYDAEDNNVWIAASYAGVGKWSIANQSFDLFRPSGPTVNYAWRIIYSNGKILTIPGGRWAVEYNRIGHVMMFENGVWTNILNDFIPGPTGAAIKLYATDFVDAVIDPLDNSHFFVATYGTGIYEFRDNKYYKLYNADNSGVETIYPTRKPENAYYKYQRIDGLKYDDEGNLWFLNNKTSSTIKYFPKNSTGAVKMLPFESIKSVETAQDIIISKQNKQQKWVLIPRLLNSTTTGMFTFNDNGTETSDDDISRLFTFFYDQDGNKFQPTNFLCVAQDQDNALWMGTTDGPIVLNNQSKAFDANYACTRIKIPRNDGTNLADFLLDGMKINAIAVDGANRKWIGTESSGVFLVSANGLETVKHFTSENSPLLSNNIISIGINEKTGEVFFGTGKGLISYQSDAIEGGDSFNNVHAFPNPVRETYKGVITITGLVTDSRVKITDITGNVVFETISNGGVATWDGNRRTGDRVATGVYLALCFSPDGKQYATAKILVIN